MAPCTAKPWLAIFPRDMIQHRRFAAEQMRRAGDVEKQAIRRIAGDKGSETVAPVGDPFQQRQIGFFIGGHDGERLRPWPAHWPGAGLYKVPAFAPALPAHGHKARCSPSADHQRRPFRKRSVFSLQPVGRKARQPQRQDRRRVRRTDSRKSPSSGFHVRQPTARWRPAGGGQVRRRKRDCPNRHPSAMSGADATCQRVCAALGRASAPSRSRIAVTPLSSAAKSACGWPPDPAHLGMAANFQQQRAHMRTGQNVAGRRQGIGGIGGPYQKQIVADRRPVPPGPAADSAPYSSAS